MSVILNVNFADSVFDTNKIEIVLGKLKLKLQNNPLQLFSQDYASSIGFTYDTNKAEFLGGKVQQKDTRPANATFYASYNSNINGNWGGGVLTGVGTGSPTISGGKLDLRGATKFVQYAGIGNANSLQVGCVRLKYTPNYSGSPASARNIFCISQSSSSMNNLIAIYHNSNGQLYLNIYNNVGVAIVVSNIDGAWVPVAGTEYEFELNWDIDTGATRLFIDGVLKGGAFLQKGTRSGTIGIFNIGGFYNDTARADGYFNDVLVFSTVQHTTNYTPDWSTIYETIYVENKVDLSQFTYAGAGNILAFTNFVTVDNLARYIINGKYWTGSAWATSDGSWAQSSPSSDVLTNIASITATNNVNISVVFQSSNSQGYADNLVLTYTGQIYPVDNPTIEPNATFRNEGLDNFIETATKTESEIKYILKKDDTWYYWNGTAWAVSDGTYSQSSTAADILTNKATFTTTAINSKVKMFLHSNDGLNTPEVDSLEIDYNFAGETPDTINKCLVWWYPRQIDSDKDTQKIKVYLENEAVKYKNNILVRQLVHEVIPNADGYCEIELIETDNMEGDQRYIFEFGNIVYKRKVPNSAEKNFWELL